MLNKAIGFVKTSFKADAIEYLTSHFGLHQVNKEPTHIFDTPSPRIGLIFTSQPNLVIKSGVHSSLHSNCLHQIIFANFNLGYIPYTLYVGGLAL